MTSWQAAELRHIVAATNWLALEVGKFFIQIVLQVHRSEGERQLDGKHFYMAGIVLLDEQQTFTVHIDKYIANTLPFVLKQYPTLQPTL